MAKWVNSAVLDGGLDAISSAATKLLLISAYTAGDSYATVVAATLAEVTIDSTDFSKADSGSNRALTLAAQSASATASSSASTHHFAITNGVDTVLWVTDETSDQAVTSGNTINFPALTYTSNQPT